jgi:hypothetical protein
MRKKVKENETVAIKEQSESEIGRPHEVESKIGRPHKVNGNS